MTDIVTPDYVQDTDYSTILSSFLSNVRNDVDKREGSIIWDAGSPCCIEIAKAYIYMQMMILNCFASTAEAPFIDYRAEEVGIDRDDATYAYRLGVFKDGDEAPFAVSIGTEFSTIDDTTLTNFAVDSVYTENGATVEGSYILKCQTAGVIGNQYFGTLTPVYSVNGLASAELTDIIIPGEDSQTTEELRAEYFSKAGTKSFSGNIAHYREVVTEIAGVGACQIYPRLAIDTNIVISIIDSTYSSPSATLINKVATALDPYYNNENYKGKGLGIVPLNHLTTVVGCTDFEIDVDASISLQQGYTIEQVSPLVANSIENLMLGLRRQWAESDDLNNYSLKAYVAKVQSVILSTLGVDNVTSVLLNDAPTDIVLTQSKQLQQIPIKGSVVLNVI